ncbi:MAG: hypothetical protein P1U32_00420 [Legionellaceae bacterium]|nr:hypothetical protein [Legionellaceae bacterium]
MSFIKAAAFAKEALGRVDIVCANADIYPAESLESMVDSGQISPESKDAL